MKRREVVVLDIQDTHFVGLSADGKLHRVKGKPNGDVGDQVQILPRKMAALKLAALAACLLLALTSALIYAPGQAATFSLAIDINPSFEFIYGDNYQIRNIIPHN